MFVGYRVGAACSAYPTVVGGPGVYRAYECWARRARTICCCRGDRWRHGRADSGKADPGVRAHSFVGAGPAWAGGGGLRGRPDWLRVAAHIGRGGDPVGGRGPVETAEAVRDRVKTDARDAVHLARLLRLGEITPVAIPSVDQEAARDLVRAREDCRGDLMRARHRLSKLLLRHGIVYCDGDAWTGKDDVWLRHQAQPQLASRATRLAFDSDYEAALAVRARRDRLDTAVEQMAADSEFTITVRRLGCLRGVSTLTGFALAVEVGDWRRFTGNTIGSFVGLVPSEHSSGSSRVQGSITKTGNTHVRRLLVEAGVAPPRPLHRGQDHAGPLGPGARSRTGPGRRGQPTPPSALGEVHRTQQKAHHRQRGDRPRARRLVLVPGRARGVGPHDLLRRRTGWWQRVERPAKHL